MSILNTRLFQLGMSFMSDMEQANDKMEKRIFSDWEKTKSMPRKMKKMKRKDLNVEYSILMWSKSLLEW